MPIPINFTKTFFYLTFFSALLPLWQINIFVKVDPFQCFGLVFIALFIYTIAYKKKIVVINKATKYLILILGMIFLVKFFSFIPAIYFGITVSDEFIVQYFKGILYEIFNTVLLISMILFLSEEQKRDEYQLMNYFLVFVLTSCFYQFSQLAAMLFFQIDLDKIIWPMISYNYAIENSLLDPLGGLEYIDFFRAGGFFGNPNAFAGFLILGFSMATIFFIFSKNKNYMYLALIIFLSIILTLSRSGLAGALIILFLIFIFYIKSLVRSYKKYLSISLIILITPIIYFYEYTNILFARLNNLDISSMFNGRTEIWSAGISVINQNPVFGYGLNNMPQTLDFYDATAYAGRDVHNYFLETIINYGVFGFLIILSLWIYLLSQFTIKNAISSSISFSVITLLIMANSSNVISQAYVFFPLILFFVLSISTNNKANTFG